MVLNNGAIAQVSKLNPPSNQTESKPFISNPAVMSSASLAPTMQKPAQDSVSAAVTNKLQISTLTFSEPNVSAASSANSLNTAPNNMINNVSPVTATIVTADQEELLWANAFAEFDSAARRPGLWAKTFAECNGDEGAAKAAYLRERVLQLQLQLKAEIQANEVALAEEAAHRESEHQARIIRLQSLKAAFTSGAELKSEQLAFLVSASDIDPSLVHLSDRLNGDMLLHRCARLSLEKEVEQLLKLGADPSAPNGNGQKPFVLASDFHLRRRLLD